MRSDRARAQRQSDLGNGRVLHDDQWIVGALLAALPGFVDLFSLEDPETKGIGVRHMTINLIVVVLFVIDAWMRRAGNTSSLPLIISVVGVLLLVASGWLGGEMVYVHGVAVAPQSPVPKSTR